MTLKASSFTQMKLKHPTMNTNNLDYEKIKKLRDTCDRILDRADKPDEIVLKEFLYNQIKLLSIDLGILSEFFRCYRKLAEKAKRN